MFGIHDLWLFIVSGLLLNIMPGPDSLLIMTRSATQGCARRLAAALGIGAGTFVHIFAAALGLVGDPRDVRDRVHRGQIVGAAYILYMAVGMLRSKRAAVQAPRWRRCHRCRTGKSSGRAS